MMGKGKRMFLKRFLAAILCLVTVFGTGSFSSFAETAANTSTTASITYSANGGTGSDFVVKDQTVGQIVAVLDNVTGSGATAKNPAFTKEGYTFLGWSDNSADTTAKYVASDSTKNTVKVVSGGVKLYAIWQLDTSNLLDQSATSSTAALTSSDSTTAATTAGTTAAETTTATTAGTTAATTAAGTTAATTVAPTTAGSTATTQATTAQTTTAAGGNVLKASETDDLTFQWSDTTDKEKDFDCTSGFVANGTAYTTLTYTKGGSKSAAAGDIQIRVPYSVFRDRDGKCITSPAPTLQDNLVSKEEYAAGAKSTAGDFYYYYEDADGDGSYDNIVFVNYAAVDPATTLTTKIGYSYTSNTFLSSPSGTINTNIQAEKKSVSDGTTITTDIPTPTVSKTRDSYEYPEWYDQWTDCGLEKPTDSENYVYLVFHIQVNQRGTQPWITTITETPGNGGKVIAWFDDYAGASDTTFQKSKLLKANSNTLRVACNKDYFSSSEYDFNVEYQDWGDHKVTADVDYADCIVAYPKSALTKDTTGGVEYYSGTVTNSVSATNKGIDSGEKTDNTSVSNQSYTIDSYTGYPGNSYNNLTTSTMSGYQEQVHYGINALLDGYSLSNILGAADGYVRYYASHTNGVNLASYTVAADHFTLGGQELTDGDYELTSASCSIQSEEEKDNQLLNKWSEERSDKVVDATVYAYVNGAWQEVKTISSNDTQSDIQLPAGTTKVKAVAKDLSTSVYLQLSYKMTLKPSTHVLSIINSHTLTDGTKLPLVGYAAAVAQDASGTVLNPATSDVYSATDKTEYGANVLRATDPLYDIYYNVGTVTDVADKTAFVDNTMHNGQYVGVSYSVSLTRKDSVALQSQNQEFSELPAEFLQTLQEKLLLKNVVYYDLLPKGAQLDVNSIAITGYSGNSTFTYNTIDNWRGSGQTMLIVTTTGTTEGTLGSTYDGNKHVSENVTMSYKVYYDYFDVNSGVTNNAICYDDANINSSSAVKTTTNTTDAGTVFGTDLQKYWSDVNGDGTTTTPVSSTSAVANWSFSLAAQEGARKQVKGSYDAVYTADANAQYGSEYTYQLMYTNGANDGKNVIMYDVLEDAAAANMYTGESAAKYWKGVLKSIDTSEATAKGIAPVIYYSTATGLSSSDIADTANLSDTATWSTTAPTDLSTVTAIAIDLTKKTDGSTYTWSNGEHVYIHLTMTAPSSSDVEYTYNRLGINYSSAMEDGTTTEVKKATGITRTALTMAKTIEAPSIKKTVTGTNYPTDATFTYSITGQNTEAQNTAISGKTATIKASDLINGTYSLNKAFGTASFLEAGTYKYIIKETSGGSTGWINDKTQYLWTVTVTDDNGTINTTSTLTKATDTDGYQITDATTYTSADFTNKYEPGTCVLDSANVKKTVTGTNYPTDATFDFTMTPDSSNPADGESGLHTTASIKASDLSNNTLSLANAFGRATFTKAGTYKYTIAETQGSVSGMTYDKSEFVWTVVVTDTNGVLTASASTARTKDTSGKATTDSDWMLMMYGGPYFTNTYTAPAVTSTTLALTGTKELTGQKTTADITEGQFTFAVAADASNDTTGYTMPADTSASVKAGGAFSFSDITFTKAGTYKFNITENDLKADGYTYDTRTVVATVTVTETNGALSAAVTYAGGATDETDSFTNSYAPKADVTIDKKLTSTSTTVGDTATYEITVTNNSATEATNVAVTENPTNLTYKDFSGTGVTASADGKTFTVAQIAAASSVTFTVNFTIDANPFKNSVIVPPTDNGSYTLDKVRVDASGNAITDGSAVNAGDTLYYNVTITAGKDANVKATAVKDLAETGLTLTAATTESGTATLAADGKSIDWTTGTIAKGTTVTMKVTATVDATAKDNVTNKATTGTQTVVVTTPVNPGEVKTPNVVVEKSDALVNGAAVKRGDAITYILTVTNKGTGDAAAVAVYDAVPANTTFASVGTEYNGQAVNSNGAVSWVIDKLAAGASVKLTFTVTVNKDVADGTLIENVATYTINHPTQPTEPLDKTTNKVVHPVTVPTEPTTEPTTTPTQPTTEPNTQPTTQPTTVTQTTASTGTTTVTTGSGDKGIMSVFTGDHAQIVILMIMVAAAGAIILVMVMTKDKKKKEDE